MSEKKGSGYTYKPNNPNVKEDTKVEVDYNNPSHNTLKVTNDVTKANGEKDRYVDKYFYKK